MTLHVFLRMICCVLQLEAELEQLRQSLRVEEALAMSISDQQVGEVEDLRQREALL